MSTKTIFIDVNGDRFMPCRCGQIHRGDYAAEDWAHHNCFHDEGLAQDDVIPEQAICVACGQTFELIPYGAAGSNRRSE